MKSAVFRLQARVPSQELADRVVAEVWDAGALGVEEREQESDVELTIYLAERDEATIRAALASLKREGLVVGSLTVIVESDWSESWKAGLSAMIISEKLLVRPSFIAHSPLPGQHELVIDPGQAFGTGGHESTQLILQWIDALALKPTEKLRVLDVGTGSGILLMAALCLGARRGLGFDLDIDAVREARVHGIKNGLADKLDFMAGPITALRAAPFDLVFANLLRTEMLPIALEISERVAVGGKLILGGLLSQDLSEVLEVFAKYGLELAGERQLSDDSGELWVAPLLIRRN